MHSTRALLLALVLSVPLAAQPQTLLTPHPASEFRAVASDVRSLSTNLFKVSIVSLAASTTFDLATSMIDAHSCQKLGTCHESNPLLTDASGRFSTSHAIAIKSGINGSLIVAELLLAKKYPRLRKAFTIINFGDAGLYAITGTRHLTLR